MSRRVLDKRFQNGMKRVKSKGRILVDVKELEQSIEASFSLDRLQRLTQHRLHQFHHNLITQTLNRAQLIFGLTDNVENTLQPKDIKFLQVLIRLFLRQRASYEADEVARLVNFFTENSSLLRFSDEDMRENVHYLRSCLSELSPIGMIHFLKTVTYVRIGQDQIFAQMIYERIKELLPVSNFDQLAQLVFNCSQSGLGDQKFCEELEQFVVENFDSILEKSHMGKNLIETQISSVKDYNEVDTMENSNLKQINSQQNQSDLSQLENLNLLVKGFAKFSFSNPSRFFDIIQDRLINKEKEQLKSNGQICRGVLWAYGIKQQPLKKELMEIISQPILGNFDELSSTEIVEICHSMSNAKQYSKSILDCVAAKLIEDSVSNQSASGAKFFKAVQIANIVHSVSLMRYYNQEMLDIAAQRLTQELHRLDSSLAGKCAMAFGRFVHNSKSCEKLMEGFCDLSLRRNNSYDFKSLVNLLWANSMLGFWKQEDWNIFVLRRLDMLHRQSLDDPQAPKILPTWYGAFHHSFLVAKASCHGMMFEQNVRKELWQQAQSAWRDNMNQEISEDDQNQISAMQRNVGEVLAESLKIKTFESNAKIGDLVVDILLPTKKLVVEVDGPTHYTTTLPYRLMS